jgi:hypothetical protein
MWLRVAESGSPMWLTVTEWGLDPAAFRQTADTSGRLARSVRMSSPLTPTKAETPDGFSPGRGRRGQGIPLRECPDGRFERPPHETSGPPNGCVFLSGHMFPHAYHIVLHGFHHPALNAIDSPVSPGMGNHVRGPPRGLNVDPHVAESGLKVTECGLNVD